MKAADLYCGAGGAARGMHYAGFDVLHGVDNNRAALQSYNESLPGDPIQHDLRTVRPGVLPPLSFDLIHGSPPCQGFSQAQGKRDPDDHRNNHVWRFVEWVEHLRPKVATMENVTGMTTISSTFMDRVIGAFREAGYRAKWRVLNAADYGVPQTRKRVFVVAVRDDLPTPSRWFPEPTHAKGGTTTLDGRELKPWRTVREAIGDLFLLSDGGVMTSQQHEAHQAAGRRPLHDTEEPARTIRGGTPPMVLPNHVEQDHADDSRAKMAEVEPGTSPTTAMTRVDADRPSPTITHGKGTPPIHYAGAVPNHEPVEPSKSAKDKMRSYAPGTTHDSVTERRLDGDRPAFSVVACRTQMIAGEDVADEPSCTVDGNGYLYERGHHYNQTEARVRRLTVREAARLQSFPDDHYFVGTKTEQYQQVGNAVPPLLMYHLARHVAGFEGVSDP